MKNRACAIGVGLCLGGVIGGGCVPAKVAPVACAAIDLAHLACGELVSVTLRDGRTVQVPRERLEGAITRTALQSIEEQGK